MCACMTMSPYVHVACVVLLQSKLWGLVHSQLSISQRQKNYLKNRTTKTLTGDVGQAATAVMHSKQECDNKNLS